MALPDINTDEVGWIAFWNHLDNGASNINPQTAGSALDGYDEYSNGIEGYKTVTYQWKTDRQVRARVKDDGWLVVWFDRAEQENLDQGKNADNVDGPWDIFTDWSYGDRDNEMLNGWDGSGDNALLDLLANLHSALDTSGGATFSRGDVGHYHYLAPGATTLTALHNYNRGTHGTYDFTPSSSVTISKCWVAGVNGYGGGTYDLHWDNTGADVWMAYDKGVGTREAESRGEVNPGEKTQYKSAYADHRAFVQLLWS